LALADAQVESRDPAAAFATASPVASDSRAAARAAIADLVQAVRARSASEHQVVAAAGGR
jgi:hypothetical protein